MSALRYSALFALLASVSACGFLPDSWSDWADNTPVIAEAQPAETTDTVVTEKTVTEEKTETASAAADKFTSNADADDVKTENTKITETTETVVPAKKTASRFTSSSDDDTSPNLTEMQEPPKKADLPSKKEISQTRKSLQKELGDKSVDTTEATPPVPKLATSASGDTTVLPLGSDKSQSQPSKNSAAVKDTASTKYTSSDETIENTPRSGPYTAAADDAVTDETKDTVAIEKRSAEADFAEAMADKTNSKTEAAAGDTPATSNDESAPAKDRELIGDLLGLSKSGEGYQLKNLGKAPKYRGGSAATIYFAKEGVAINQAQFANLKKVADNAKKHGFKIKIVGTPVSSDMPTLGTQRLINLAAYLVDFGVSADKVNLQLIDKFASSDAETSPRAEVILSK